MRKLLPILVSALLLIISNYTFCQSNCPLVNWENHVIKPKTEKEKIGSIYIYWMTNTNVLDELNKKSFNFGKQLRQSLEDKNNTQALKVVRDAMLHTGSFLYDDNENFKCVVELLPLLKKSQKYYCSGVEALIYIEKAIMKFDNPSEHIEYIISILSNDVNREVNGRDYQLVLQELNRLDAKYSLSKIKITE